MHNPSTLPVEPLLVSLLERLRKRVRRYIWAEAVATIVLASAFLFWLSLAIDWFFEPSAGARLALLILLVFAWLVSTALAIRRALVPLSNRSMAILLERRFPSFRDSLLTSIELAGPGEHFTYDPELLSHTVDEARQTAQAVNPRLVLRASPLVRKGIAAFAMVASLVALLVVAPFVMRVWASRVLLLSDTLWPRATRLVVEGFANGEEVVARGGDLAVVVLADAAKIVPDSVEVRSTSAEGTRDRKPMIRVGEAKLSGEPFQHFKHTFQAVGSSIVFDVIGGDDRRSGLRVRVVEPPVIDRINMKAVYPEYMARAERTLPVAAATQVPVGSRVSLQARSNKKLRRAEMRRADPDSSSGPVATEIALGADAQSFSLDFEPIEHDATLEFMLEDLDRIKNRSPIRLALNAVEDAPPEIQARPRGVGAAITAKARVPISGKIVDDYGVRRAWLEFTIDNGDPQRIELRESPEAVPEIGVETALDVAEITTVADLSIPNAEPAPLAPGQKLSTRVCGEDAFMLEGHAGPHVGLGELFTWDIVSPESLRAMLEAREMNLRLRFDQIIEEVVETRDTLAALKLTADAAPSQAIVEPGEQPSPAAASKPEERLARNHLRVQGALQAGRKSADESMGVATSFDGIRDEFINNRLDSEELRIRLEDQISQPLKMIAGTMFPELHARVQAFDAKLSEAAGAGEAQRAAVAQSDKIIVEMHQVRDRMLELETFNEALDILRRIASDQEALNKKTLEERRAKVRNLLDEGS